jgi:hypothetical protein
MDSNRLSSIFLSNSVVSTAPVEMTTHHTEKDLLQDSVEYDGNTDWDALTSTISWESESAGLNAGLPSEPFGQFSVRWSSFATA